MKSAWLVSHQPLQILNGRPVPAFRTTQNEKRVFVICIATFEINQRPTSRQNEIKVLPRRARGAVISFLPSGAPAALLKTTV